MCIKCEEKTKMSRIESELERGQAISDIKQELEDLAPDTQVLLFTCKVSDVEVDGEPRQQIACSITGALGVPAMAQLLAELTLRADSETKAMAKHFMRVARAQDENKSWEPAFQPFPKLPEH